LLTSTVRATDSGDAYPPPEEYDIKGFPTIKFFPADGEMIAYEGGRSEEAIIKYLNEKCGTHRAVGGLLTKEVIDINCRLAESLHLIPLSKLTSTSHPRPTRPVPPRPLLNGRLPAKRYIVLYTNLAKHYAKFMTKVSADPKFTAKEIARLTSIIKGGNTDAKKVDDFIIRRNILQVFAGAETEAEAEAEEVNEDL
jgi:protein disulfide-isomerase A6